MQKGIILRLLAVAVVAVLLGWYIVWDKQHAQVVNAPTNTSNSVQSK